ncbi:MAG: hypothetical protein J6386_04185 [Candidatus Synoicihabitans palmerolidicus]|nr:hypothetical protein [Candidatus Synoicihabitans palmerolidicus]
MSPRPRRWVIGWHRDWAFLDEAASERLKSLYQGKRFDRVICLRLSVRDVANEVRRWAAISEGGYEIDYDDYESKSRASIAAGLWGLGYRWAGLMTGLDALWVRRVERKLLPEFAQIWLATESDREAMRTRLPELKMGVFENCPSVRPVERLDPVPVPKVGFVGALGDFPNQDSLRFLVNEVWPKLRSRSKEWRLLVAGRELSDPMRAWLDAADGVEYLGEFDNI